jgi:hypothetical protein
MTAATIAVIGLVSAVVQDAVAGHNCGGKAVNEKGPQ